MNPIRSCPSCDAYGYSMRCFLCNGPTETGRDTINDMTAMRWRPPYRETTR